MSEEENPSDSLPGTGGIDSKYSLEEMNSISTLFETWHDHAHSALRKYDRFKIWFKTHKESSLLMIQAMIIFYLRFVEV